jgi:hypothetical protein
LSFVFAERTQQANAHKRFIAIIKNPPSPHCGARGVFTDRLPEHLLVFVPGTAGQMDSYCFVFKKRQVCFFVGWDKLSDKEPRGLGNNVHEPNLKIIRMKGKNPGVFDICRMKGLAHAIDCRFVI